MSLETKLRKLREQKGWSQMDIAHQLDISQPAYNKWETGQAKPTLQNLQKIAEIFEVDFFDLIQEQMPSIDLSNSQFEGNSYIVSPIVINPTESNIFNFQSQDLIEKILENQEQMAKIIENQSKLIESLLKK
ncbi:helix-turn-helix transcriptional regulator [Chryseobacterium mucoviscidosis]|uniref:helix-turn-helix domain-containing protein n=1 Tax=Chryseobacterium mucoviscidosis TaxID=1945581 RepID=UPI00301922FF